MKSKTENMFFLNNICCICMNKNDLKPLFDVDNDGVSHFNKLISSIVEMNFKEMNDQRLICGECCVTLNTVYNFRQMCLRSKTNLITYLSQLHTSSNVSGTLSVRLTDLNPQTKVENEGIVIKCENEGIFEENIQQHEFQTESYEHNIQFPASVKEEWESEEEASSAHEDATADHVNESYVKVEDVEQQTTMEDEAFMEYSEIDIEEDPLAVVKVELLSDTETPQDGSTSQADAGTSQEPKESEGTTVVGGLHRCKICNKGFAVKKYLTTHMKIHNGATEHKCEICHKTFKFRSYLLCHLKIHSDERPFECEICKKSFPMKKHLTQHMKLHSDDKPYECAICKRNFASRSNLTAHLRKHSAKSQFECEICKKEFRYKHSLNVHMTTHSDDKPYECEVCKKRFTGKYTLALHEGVHSREKPFKCEICNKSFIQRTRLDRHIRTHSAESLG